MPMSQQHSKRQSKQRGFNLIELVIVIVVAGVLAVVISPIIMKPFLAYEDTTRRVALVDAAESAMRQIARDVRDAIPNTVRTNGTVLELMPIQGGGRYRSKEITEGDNSSLNASALDNEFLMLGNSSSLPAGARVVIYNTGATQFYTAATSGGLGIITPTSTTVSALDTGNEDTISLTAAFQFDPVGNGSPGKRFYIATTPVTYHCDVALGTILRFEGYATTVSQPTNRNASPLTGATSSGLLVDNVSACSFAYSPGSNTRAGLLIMSISLTIDGETINLLHQVHTGNAP